MQILITGVNSVLGINLSNYFLNRNHHVTGIFNRKDNNLKLLNKKCKTIKLNLRKFNKKKLPQEIDIVIHIAASTKDSDKNINEINYVGSKKLFNYSSSFNAKLFIFFSSISIDLDKNNKVKKNYINSKKKAEKYFKKNNDLKVISLRLPAILSPQPNKSLWIYNMLDKLKKNKMVKIYNPSSHTNHFIHYTDLVKFINKLTKFKNLKNYDEINICSRGKIRIIDLVKMMKKNTNSNSKIKIINNNSINSLIDLKKLDKNYFYKSLYCKTAIKKFLFENKN